MIRGIEVENDAKGRSEFKGETPSEPATRAPQRAVASDRTPETSSK